MHIPDGLLDLRTAGAAAALSATAVGGALRRLRTGLPRRRVPLMGLSAAFVFAAQMLNFPVAAGTSGHLIGATLAAVLLGPGAAVVVMAAVLIVQCLLFADGGLLALGANVLNMAVIGTLAGAAVHSTVRRLLPGDRGLLAAAAFAAWCSTVAAAMACAAELAAAGVVRWALVFPAMAGVHMVIGLGEALITALVLAAVLRTRPDLLGREDSAVSGPSLSRVAVAGVAAVILGLLLFGIPFASTAPDGLESVAATLGFRAPVHPNLYGTPMPDYRVQGLSSSAATCLAGLVGTLVTFGIAYALAAALTPRRRAAGS